MTGEELKALRLAACLTQGALGEAIGLSREHIIRLEKGTTPISKANELAVRAVLEKGNAPS
jgi:transcriptional regulator with XRE-family HTH domain